MAYNLVGQVFGQLTVVEKLAEKEIVTGRIQWKCLCLCGNYKILSTYRLTDKLKGTVSCGKCEWQLRHKDAYISWCSLKQRCDYPENKDYANYGGRGIKYSLSWHKFINFFLDMGDPPLDPISGERLSLDRIDVNGNYCKENCRWATRSEQQLNKRQT